MLNKKELELLKQTGVNDKEVTEKLVNFLRHEFDNVVRVKKEDYNKEIVKLVDNKQGSYTFIDNDSGDFLAKVSIFNYEKEPDVFVGLNCIALTKQGWLLTCKDGNFETFVFSDLLDENTNLYGINLVDQLQSLDGQEIATKEGTLPVYEVTGNESVIEFVNENNLLNKMFVLKNGNNCLIVDNVIFDDSDNYYYFKGVLYLNYDSGSIHFTDEAYSTEDFADTIDALFYAMSEVSLLATIRYVDNNKGTKLYRHEATGTYTDKNDNVYTAYVEFIATESISLPSIDSGLVSIVNGRLELNNDNFVIIKYDYSMGELICYDLNNATIYRDNANNFHFTNDTVTPL